MSKTRKDSHTRCCVVVFVIINPAVVCVCVEGERLGMKRTHILYTHTHTCICVQGRGCAESRR